MALADGKEPPTHHIWPDLESTGFKTHSADIYPHDNKNKLINYSCWGKIKKKNKIKKFLLWKDPRAGRNGKCSSKVNSEKKTQSPSVQHANLPQTCFLGPRKLPSLVNSISRKASPSFYNVNNMFRWIKMKFRLLFIRSFRFVIIKYRR